MRIEYDPRADAAYVYLTGEPLTPGRISVSCPVPDDVPDDVPLPALVVIDWKDGKIAGLEVISASALLHADLLAQAERPGSRQAEAEPTET